LQPAYFNVGVFQMFNFTNNRRAGSSKYVKPSDIDPQLGLFRVDSTTGQPLATLWNFAIHGTCYGASNMKYSADIMGKVSENIEKRGVGVALFVNGDAGDISPGPGVCNGAPEFPAAIQMATKIMEFRNTVKPANQVSFKADSKFVNFGNVHLNLSFARMANCTQGGFLNICTICEVLKCTLDLQLNGSWVENVPRFAGMRITVDNKIIGVASVPGEAIQELGTWIKDAGKSLGYQETLIFGYSNSHMGYFTTPREYEVGGYESQLTLFGIDTADKVRDGAKAALTLVRA